MNPKLPKDIEELVWAVAESGSDAMESDFIARYPQYRAHLATRKAMLEVLRKARPTDISARAFRTPKRSTNRWWLVPVCSAALLTLAFAGYQITQSMTRSAPKVMPSTNEVPTVSKPPVRGGVEPIPGATRQGDPGTTSRPEPVTSIPVVTVRAGKHRLKVLLSEIAKQGKVTILTMPDVADATLEVKPNRTGNLAVFTVAEILRLVEEATPVRVIDGGTDGFYIVPLEKVKNLDQEQNPDKLSTAGD